MISHPRRCFAVGCLLVLLSSLAFAQGGTIKPKDALILEIVEDMEELANAALQEGNPIA